MRVRCKRAIGFRPPLLSRASTRADRAATAERATSAFAIERSHRRPGPDGSYWCEPVTILTSAWPSHAGALGQSHPPATDCADDSFHLQRVIEVRPMATNSARALPRRHSVRAIALTRGSTRRQAIATATKGSGDQSTGSPAWRRSCSVARYLVLRVRPSCTTRPASRSRLRS